MLSWGVGRRVDLQRAELEQVGSVTKEAMLSSFQNKVNYLPILEGLHLFCHVRTLCMAPSTKLNDNYLIYLSSSSFLVEVFFVY